jgi:hypothetical protein
MQSFRRQARPLIFGGPAPGKTTPSGDRTFRAGGRFGFNRWSDAKLLGEAFERNLVSRTPNIMLDWPARVGKSPIATGPSLTREKMGVNATNVIGSVPGLRGLPSLPIPLAELALFYR